MGLEVPPPGASVQVGRLSHLRRWAVRRWRKKKRKSGLLLACEMLECILSGQEYKGTLVDEDDRKMLVFARERIEEAGGTTTGPPP